MKSGSLVSYVAFSGLVLLAHPASLLAADPNVPTGTAHTAHWAFQEAVRPALPKVRAVAWVETPIDAFILAKQEAAGLAPSPPADRLTLLRRVSFDLLGLPPTPSDIEAFLKDDRPDAYERVVNRLLASPQYGERWAQHWLDVVRYAESNGYEGDAERPHAWRYRDYVIRSLNEDKPFERFLTEQLAGDLLARGQDPRSAADLLSACGMNRCGQVHLTSGNTDAEINRQEVLTEMTTGVGAAFLGLTVGCARCHDHKFDPFPQVDYYRLQAFFAGTQFKDVDIATAEEKAAHEQRTKNLNARMAPLKQQVAALDDPVRARLMDAKNARLEPAYRDALAVNLKNRTREQRKLAEDANTLIKVTWDEIVGALNPEQQALRAQLRRQIHELEAQLPPPPPGLWTVAESCPTPPTHVLVRGNPKQKAAQVEAGFPAAVTDSVNKTSGALDRRDLARWLTRPDHALTARVLVNRLWQHHFGRGIVSTPNDFGLRGDRPSHPELLDWLAREFVERRWSIKEMHRIMLLSAAYRQASRPSADHAGLRVDPDNRLLWHARRQRLEGEPLRDSLLAVSGRLNVKQRGPMVRVPLEPEVYELIFTEGEPDGLWHVTPDVQEHTRRSIYLFAKRNVRLPLFEAFDQPDTLNSCPLRPVSTFAPQALILFNGPFFQEQSRAFAGRVLIEAPEDVKRQIYRAYALALGRPPRSAELSAGLDFLTSQADLHRGRLLLRQRVPAPPHVPDGVDPAHAAAMCDFALALMNRNEFLYVN